MQNDFLVAYLPKLSLFKSIPDIGVINMHEKVPAIGFEDREWKCILWTNQILSMQSNKYAEVPIHYARIDNNK